MQKEVDRLLIGWQKRGHQLGFGIGIDQGYATLGKIGFEGRFDYAAIGTVTNLATRLCDTAEAEQILISQRVYGAVERRVDSHPWSEPSKGVETFHYRLQRPHVEKMNCF